MSRKDIHTASPFFSVIVPAYGVQDFLHACLDSVLGQDLADLELIAVDDCSPDGSGAILDAYAANDDRIRVLHLAENVGLGLARNAGLEWARGRYILFLDGDDTLAADSLSILAQRLVATKDPEILIFGHARTYWDGSAHRSPLAHLLDEGTGAPTFRLAERPEILELPQMACNKAYRRAFVEEYGLTFPVGFYEDAPWNFRVLTTARTIAVLDRVCLHYRQRRQGGNILRTTGLKHFDVFDQYQRVFDHIDAHPELSRWRPHMFRKMADHYMTILEHPDRLPRNTKAEFLRRASHDYHQRLPADFVRPDGTVGRTYALLDKGP